MKLKIKVRALEPILHSVANAKELGAEGLVIKAILVRGYNKMSL
jgi:hypothetical protein